MVLQRFRRFLACDPRTGQRRIMRDPVAPIPSPFVVTERARGFWSVGRPPPPPHRDEPPSYDPTRLLVERGDVLGIDRRAGPRASNDATPGSAVTAARHVDVRAYFGLQTPGGWALVRGLCMSPRGVLVHLFDPCDPELDADEIGVAGTVFRRLAPVLDRHATAGRPAGSPLAAVGGCVLAPRVVADLSRWANGRATRRSCGGRRAIDATLVLPLRESSGDGAFERIPGEIVPLNDPHPDVLGIALDSDAVRRFARALARVVTTRPVRFAPTA
jgi:hypothetical protein